ncbi:MAG TPA: hypothetical protein VGV40_07320 [Solirubrobacteraceae bacterium]|nr:hypothetical protein [Solirubrobacteraceae bacterium]
MLGALLWGTIASSSLLVGAAVGVRAPLSQRMVGLCMGLGGGARISAVSFELAADALRRGGAGAVALGLAVGALGFFAGNAGLQRRGAHRRHSPGGTGAGPAGALALGALLDGVPESASLGMTLGTGGDVGIALVVAIFLSNVPEALASAANMREGGASSGHVLGLWGAIAGTCVAATVAGSALLAGLSGGVVGVILAFAAGAILAMLADTMVPEAYGHGGRAVGLLTVLGFALSFLLSEA